MNIQMSHSMKKTNISPECIKTKRILRVNKVLATETCHNFIRSQVRCLRSGGFFLACEDLGRMFDHSFPARAFFVPEVEISSRTLISLLRQEQYTVAQRAEPIVAEYSLTSSRFRLGSHTMPGQRHSQPTPISLSQGCIRV